jgi:hypothetical protein
LQTGTQEPANNLLIKDRVIRQTINHNPSNPFQPEPEEMVRALCIQQKAMSPTQEVCPRSLLRRTIAVFRYRAERDIGCLVGSSEEVPETEEVVVAWDEDEDSVAAFSWLG